ncbi:MAG TPA: AarF/UbiB family protein [Gemmatimonadaceae bacterium]|nr:AarF/UbiB family protein [Gemmatimonadaceae bacterium]
MELAQRLSRYTEFATFVAKYSRSDVLADTHGNAAATGDADELVCDVERLGPTFVKLGQLLSTRADLLKPAYAEALARLQDDVAPFPFDEVVRIVEGELQVRLSKAFTSFDEAPIAAASLGQVHRAVLRDGRQVAVKVQRPGVREQVAQDLETLGDVASLLERFSSVTRSVDVQALLEQFRMTILAELDYRQEAHNMSVLARHLRDVPEVLVPLPVEDYTTGRVLTMDYVRGTKITAVSPVEWTEVDGRALAEALFRAYLQQILVDGFFHADPHPGNVLLTADHRLGLVDVGMIGRLSTAVQERLYRLLLAIADGDDAEAALVVVALGERLDGFDEASMRRSVTALVSQRDHRADGLNVGRVMLDLARTAHRCGLRMPAELPLLGKTLLNLHDIGRVLDPTFDMERALRRHATALMRRRMKKNARPTHWLPALLGLRELALRLPERANRILDALAANDVRLKVEVIDHGSIIDGLQKVANRIALGAVLAALIIGAAMLMQVRTSFTILGYPGFAMLLFLAAVAGGVWLAWTILSDDVKKPVRR